MAPEYQAGDPVTGDLWNCLACNVVKKGAVGALAFIPAVMLFKRGKSFRPLIGGTGIGFGLGMGFVENRLFLKHPNLVPMSGTFQEEAARLVEQTQNAGETAGNTVQSLRERIGV